MTAMENKINEAELRAQFKELKDELAKWGTYVDEQLNEFADKMFRHRELVQFRAKHRIKDEESFVQKALRRGKGYKDPLLEITDKVGTRIVLLQIGDVEKVVRFIKESDGTLWEIYEYSKDIEKIRFDKPDTFGYQSAHFLVKPLKDTVDDKLRDYLNCEIQVRTILQHAWAEVSHDTTYKTHVEHMEILTRKMAAAMAFIEEADEKFKEIYEMVNTATDIYNDVKFKLIGAYQDIVNDFIPDRYDSALTELLFKLFSDEELKQFKEDMGDFMAKYQAYIPSSIEKNRKTKILFSQPLILLACYAVNKYPTRVAQYWPYDYDSMELVFKSMGKSEEMYRS